MVTQSAAKAMKSMCRVISAAKIAEPFTAELKQGIADLGFSPTLRAFLANDDQYARDYAHWTSETALELGFRFELHKVKNWHLEDAILDANRDPNVHGIMNYWPVFPDPKEDVRIQRQVSPQKDVEGFSPIFIENLYSNIRYFDPPKNLQKSILPATPLALVKALEHIGVYNPLLERGSRLYGKTITIVNRSDIVGRPLAALCANDGATVYSIDLTGSRRYTRDRLKLSCHRWEDIDTTLEQASAMSDAVICGVPSETWKFPSDALKDGAVAINFSSNKNFDKDSIKEHASIYTPSIGKVTITMLFRNLLRLAQNQQNVLAEEQAQTESDGEAIEKMQSANVQ